MVYAYLTHTDCRLCQNSFFLLVFTCYILAAAVLRLKHSACCSISWLFCLWVIMCIWVYGIMFMYMWIHPWTFSPEENLWYPVPSLIICFPRILVPLWSWTYRVSWSSEEAISPPTSALDNTEFTSAYGHTYAFYDSVEIWTQAIMPTKESTLPLWAIFPASYHQLILLSFQYIHICLHFPSLLKLCSFLFATFFFLLENQLYNINYKQ